MYHYALIKFSDGTYAYQESMDGDVVRYCDVLGKTLENYPPNCGAEIVSDTQLPLPWMKPPA